jgi:hypothetical protein
MTDMQVQGEQEVDPTVIGTPEPPVLGDPRYEEPEPPVDPPTEPEPEEGV